MTNSNPTACVVVIGNEVLSGRTRDANIQFLAQRLGDMGIPVREVRIIPDVADVIIRTINEARAAFDHVFTTGGIGPTHDDITSECIAAAFGVAWEKQPVVWARMEAHYPAGGFNAARQRMATMPRGAVLIDDGRTIAPGFSMVNVHVMAGVPAIMRAMFDMLAPRLQGGTPIVSRSVHAADVREGDIAAGLTDIQAKFPELDIGSYPYYRDGGGGVAIVAKGTSAAQAEQAVAEVTRLFEVLGGKPKEGEPK